MKKEKLVTCKKCENIYNRKIKRCPNCNSINRRLLIRKILQLTLLLSILAFLIIYCNSKYIKNDNLNNDNLIEDNIEFIENSKTTHNDEQVMEEGYLDNNNSIQFADENGQIASDNKNNLDYVDRSNSVAEEIEISAGQYVVGEAIKPGRYVCTSIDDPAVVAIYDNNGQQTFYELVGKTEDGYGTQTLTIDLMEGYIVEVPDGTISLLPITTDFTENLSTGNWYVGIDIKPGLYDAKCNNGDGSIIFVDGENNITSIIDSVKTDFTTQLELVEGQQIRIYTIDELELTPVE